MAIDRMNLLRTMGSILLALVLLDAILVGVQLAIKASEIMSDVRQRLD